MKSLQLLFVLLFISSGSFAQYSGTYFERMGPYSSVGVLSTEQMLINMSFGIPLPNGGGLGVRFADSLGTQVQWVKLDPQGNPSIYSSNLPGDSVNRLEKIINVFDDGVNQFIVSIIIPNSQTNTMNKLRVYKFLNYTNLINHSELTILGRNTKHPVYFENDKIYTYCFLQGFGVKEIVIKKQDLSILSNELINTEINAPLLSVSNTGFVRFENDSTRQFYAITNDTLYRINRVNNLTTTTKRAIDGITLLAILPQENKLKVFTYSSGYKKLKTYDYIFDDENTLLIPTDSISLMNINTPTTLLPRNLAYQKNGQREYMYESSLRKMFEYENNQLIDSVNIFNLDINNFQTQNGYLFLSGNRNLIGQGLTQLNYLQGLSLKLNFLSELGKYTDFNRDQVVGDTKFAVNIGQTLINSDYNSRDRKFGNFLFFLTQQFAGKSQNVLRGYHVGNYSSTFKPGPYTQISSYSQSELAKYNKVIYIDLNTVNAHVSAFNSGSTTYQIPKSILNWPAHGDVSKGQDANLAPFVDVNENGIYEPTLGDYPSFPGTYCFLNITHQHKEDFDNTGLGLEFQTYMYGFDCNDSISDALFIRTEVYNRSDLVYDSLAAGILADFDIGSAFDDYVGTHVEKGLIYGYNADDYDESFQGVLGLQDSLASCAIQFLKGVPILANGLDDSPGIGTFQTVNGYGFNDGIVDNEFKGLEYSRHCINGGNPLIADPKNNVENFNTLIGKWIFGDAKTYGGNGLDPLNDSIFSRYSYPDDSDPMHYGTYGIDPGYAWSEVSNGNPTNNDKRMIGSFGSTPLAPGQQITYHSAVLISKRIPGFMVSNQDLFAKAGHIRRVFAANETDCGQTFGNLTEEMITGLAPAPEMLDMNIYPNPFTEIIQVEAADFGGEVLVQVFDLQGKEVFRSSEKTSLFSLNLASQDAGMYLLQLSNWKGKSIRKIQKIK